MSDARGFSDDTTRPSIPVLAAIAVLHVALLYGLIRALAPDLTIIESGPSFAAFEVGKPSPSPTPTPAPTQAPAPGPPDKEAGDEGDPGKRAVASAVTAPQPPIPLPSRAPAPRAASTGTADSSGAADAGDGTGASGQGDGTGAGGEGRGIGGGGGIAEGPSLARSITNVSAFPVPPGGRQARVGKRTLVMLDVSAQGRVTGCRVTQSSGFPDTDAKVCELAYDQIRFEPARDDAGNPVPSRFHYQQRFFE
ncbi:energy transducer TonB [Alteriqipengyuania sp. 357]